MMFTPKNELTLLPQPSTDCYDKRCFTVFNNTSTQMIPYKIEQINLEILIQLPEGYILKVINHAITRSPWQILGNYFYPDQGTKELLLPVMSPIECVINEGDVLCHIQLIATSEVYNIMLSKYYFI